MSKSTKSKDASTRFMRVDQLGSAPTVAVPASELLAAAAAANQEPQRTAGRRSQDEIATRAMPLVPAATPPAPTVMLRADSAVVRADAAPVATARPKKSWRAHRTRGRTVAAGAMALVAVSLIAFASTRVRHAGRAGASAATGPDTAAQAAPAKVTAGHEDTSTTPTPEPAATPTAKSTPTEPTPAQLAPKLPVSPAVAVDQLASGDYAAALTSYRELALSRPEEPVFALIVVLLDRKQRTRCTGDQPLGASSCAQ